METTTEPISHLIAATRTVTDARLKVQAFSAVALAGGRHDPEVLDAAIISHRRARQDALAALAEWARARQSHSASPERRRASRAA